MRTFLTFLLMLMSATSARSEVWQITEGTKGDIEGIWEIRDRTGNHFTGIAHIGIHTDDFTQTYQFEGDCLPQPNIPHYMAVVVSRVGKITDGVQCTYTGVVYNPGRQIIGQAHCNIATVPWTARSTDRICGGEYEGPTKNEEGRYVLDKK
jgi:hypothetical protein